MTSPIDSIGRNLTLSSAWTTESPIFRRYGTSKSGNYYRVFEVTAATAGLYSLAGASNIDTVGYLYEKNFNPSKTDRNLVTYDGGRGGSTDFHITLTLNPGLKYYLVVTTSRRHLVGRFSVSISGPAEATLVAADG